MNISTTTIVHLVKTNATAIAVAKRRALCARTLLLCFGMRKAKTKCSDFGLSSPLGVNPTFPHGEG